MKIKNKTINNIKINKKAISQVIITVFLIMISVTAITILGILVNKTIKNAQFSPQVSCLEMQTSLQPVIKIEKVCYNNNSNDAEITIRRNVDDKMQINSLIFILDSNLGRNSFSCGNSCGNCQILNLGSKKTYYLNNLKNNQEQKLTKVTIKVDNCIIETKSIVDC